MKSQIKTYPREAGQIQRLHIVYPERWEQLDFLKMEPAEDALERFAHIYRQFLVPACPWLFGNMVMFTLPEDVEVEYSFNTGRFGQVSDRLIAATAGLRRGLHIVRGKPLFRDAETRRLWEALCSRNAVTVISGKLPITTIIPVMPVSGYLSHTKPEAALKVNASFFIMDRFDCATVYDRIGTVLGLCVKDGAVENPPLYHREALLVRKDGSVHVELPQLQDLKLQIGKHLFIPGENAAVYSRPDRRCCPNGKGKRLVIIGCQVVAVAEGGALPIPASGFILCPQAACDAKPGDRVTYHGMEDVVFGIQVGNSLVREGKITEKFISRFYNIRALEPLPYPPSLYNPDYRKARAARIALGADKDGNPMVVWAEGAAKLGHRPGEDSTGASLLEMAKLCADLGMVNGVNLDGGGSAQLLMYGKRSLRISDRADLNGTEAERPIPLGLVAE